MSVVTATYNRAHLLPRLYESLLAQASRNFEWVVVDDGSSDDTEAVVEGWRTEADFDIRYVAQDNLGKHVALNAAFRIARGEYCFIVDSDDWLAREALQVAGQWIKDVADRPDIVAVAGLKALKSGAAPSGTPAFKGAEFVECSNLERKAYGLLGDNGAELYRRRELVLNPFPVFEGEKFISEGVLWNRLAMRGYKVRWHNHVIYQCEYQSDGLSGRALESHVESFQGYVAYLESLLPSLSSADRARNLGMYARVARSRGLPLGEAAKTLSVRRISLITFGAAYSAKDCLRLFSQRGRANG